MNADDPISSLAAVVELRREMTRLEAVTVRRSRAQSNSWTEIAAALGISKQAVRKTYGGRGLSRSPE